VPLTSVSMQPSYASSVATVTFAENATLDDSVVTFQADVGSAPLTLFQNLSPQFVNTGYTFENWNTLADGSGTTYSDGATYNFGYGDIVLWAQWQMNDVTFYQNRNGLDSVTATQTSSVSTSLTLFSSLVPEFSNPGYNFAGWNTNPLGSGTSYANGATYDFTKGNLVLYAQWTPIPLVSATFASMSGSGSVSSLTAQSGTSVTLPSGSGFTNPGFTFVSWNTSANGLGTTYLPGATVVLNANLTLYAQWTANSVTFYENAGPGDSVHVTQISSVDVALTRFSDLSPSFTNAGYAFAGWTTQANGSGTFYADAATFNFLAGSATLYAKWSATPKETIHFDGNGGSGLGGDISGLQGASVTLLGSGAFTFEGYSFVSWNTAADGSGTAYAAGANLTLSTDLTLYAIWSPNVYTVTYNGSGGSVSPTSTTFTVGTTPLTLPLPTYVGHIFAGWYSAASGGTLVGSSGDAFSPSGSTTLYEHWTLAVYTVTFDAQGGTVSPTSTAFTFGSTPITLPTPSLTGSSFAGWFSAPSGGTLVGSASSPFTPNGDITLYAHWTSATFTVTFDPNGGSGSIAPLSGPAGSTVTVPGVAGLSRAGYTLVRWSTSRDGGGTSYAAGSALVLNSSLTLYAQWTGHAPAVNLGAVGPFAGRSVRLTVAMKRQVAHLAAVVKARHLTTVLVYGYVPSSGLVSLDLSISRQRAAAVATYLRARLAALHVRATLKAAGEGSLPGATSANRKVVLFGY
jgi:uncharacterized repeat protein (TIGR02543 family)